MYDYLLPEIPENFVILTGWMEELGYFSIKGGDTTALSFEDIYYWQKLFGYNVEAWEVSTLIKMSVKYVTTIILAKDEKYPPPMEIELSEEQRKRVKERIFG